jgi:hypothetical protein
MLGAEDQGEGIGVIQFGKQGEEPREGLRHKQGSP